MFESGGYKIATLVIDRLKLDGGAMFGAVPKVLWSKRIASDERNRIQLACRLLVLSNEDRLILIDTGCGSKWTDKLRDIYAIQSNTGKQLHELLPSVTDVILTHLHFDHGGGVSYKDSANNLCLSFATATHYLNVDHWEHARSPGVREQASYLSENINPLGQANLKLTTNSEEILPNIQVFQVDGHTHGLQWILIGKGEQAIAYPSDLIPTSHHISIPYVMGYDLNAEKSMSEKENFLRQAAAHKWIVLFEHDPETPAVRIGQDEKGRYCITEKVAIPEYSII